LKNIYSRFLENVQSNPGKTSICGEGSSISYKDLYKSAERLSEILLENDVKQGAKLGVVLENGYEFATLLLAASKNDLTLVPQSTDLPADKATQIFNLLEIDCLVSSPTYLRNIKHKHKEIKKIAINSGDIFNWIDEFTHHIEVKAQYKNHPFIVTLTSGSTGSPKPIALTQNIKIKRILSAKELYQLSMEDIILVGTPMYHSLAQRLTLLPLFLGGTCVILKKFSLNLWLGYVERFSVSFTIAVASQLKQLVHSNLDNYNLSSLRVLVSSSELLPYQDKLKLIDNLECDFNECYGASEIGIATNLSMQNTQTKKGSIGKPISGVDIKIIDPIANINLNTGEIGEICVKSIMEFDSYYQNKELTENAYISEYFKTGDLGKFDKDGYLYFHGRNKEIIITGGINIYPKDIEDEILKIRGVRECSVIGVPDTSLGEVPVAVISVEDSLFNLRDVKLSCINNLASSQIPRKFIQVDRLAKNEVGKIQKKLVFEQVQSLL